MVDPNHIVFFDGECNLCNHSVQLIIKRDPKAKFKFASLQSDTGVEFRKTFNVNISELSTIILYQNDKVYKKTYCTIKNR